MKVLMIMGCGVIAAACATGKRAEEPVDYPGNDESTTVTTRTNSPERTVAPDYNDSSPPSDPEGSAQTERAERTPAARGDARASGSQLSTVREKPASKTPQAPPLVAAPVPKADADNTANNERDRGGDTLTPTDQGSSDVDMMLTQQIRKAVVGDSSLSFSAKNVKIISQGGKVTLRGSVKSDRERKAIGDMALKIAGAGKVDNQLEVAN